jgi:hypothetical protein
MVTASVPLSEQLLMTISLTNSHLAGDPVAARNDRAVNGGNIPDANYIRGDRDILLEEVARKGAPERREVLDILRAERSLVLDGDQTFGTVSHHKEIHPLRSRPTPASLDLIASSQLAVLRDLIATGSKVVAAEGQAESIFPSTPDRENLLPVKRASEAFPGGIIPAELSQFQQSELVEMGGAAWVYAALNPPVTLLRTTTPEFEDILERIQKDPNIPAEKKDTYVFGKREGFALQEVCRFLKSNPGEKVDLVFGRAHHFGMEDLHRNSKLPVMHSVSYPGVDAIFPKLQEAGEDTTKQSHMIGAARYIAVWDFSRIASPTDQLKALPLLAGQAQIYESATEFKESLLREARTIEVQAEIEKRFAQRSRPFAEMYPKQDVSWSWSTVHSMHPVDVSKLFDQKLDDVTQTELVRRASSIYSYDFQVLTSSFAQLEALKKLHVNPGSYGSDNAGVLKQHLIDNAVSDTVIAAIESLYAEKRGPFPLTRK